MNNKWLEVFQRNRVNLNHPASSEAAIRLGKDVLSYREELLNYFLAIDKNKLVMGHFKCTRATREHYQNSWHFVTLIREPINRWYSHYYFDRFREKNLHYKKTDLDLATYLSSEEGLQNARLYTRHFSGFVNNRDEINWAYAEEAADNVLNFNVYGVLDDLDTFSKKYESVIGTKLKIPYKNKNPKKNYRKENISEELRRRVEDFCKYDKFIYDKVKESIKLGSSSKHTNLQAQVNSPQKATN